MAVEEDLAFVGVVEAHDELEDRALPRAVRADNDLAGGEMAQTMRLQGDVRITGPRRA